MLCVYFQKQFIHLWKTFYSLFRDLPNEQELYKAIASVGTLLLNLGELSAPDTRFENSSNLCNSTVDNPSTLSKPVGDNSSNRPEPVHSMSNHLDSSNSSHRLLGQSPSSGSPLSDSGSVQRRLCEALADAATDCSPGSRERNANDDEFIRVGSEDSLLSSPEVIDLDDEAKLNVQIDSDRMLSATSEKTTISSDRAPCDSETFTNGHEVSDHSAKDSETLTKTVENLTDHECEKDGSSSFERVGNGTRDVKESEETERRRSTGNVDPYWCITFEQFLASVLTEPLLVEYFEEQTNIEEIINTVKTEGVRDFVRNPRRSLSVE